jgi:hypothetical protein
MPSLPIIINNDDIVHYFVDVRGEEEHNGEDKEEESQHPEDSHNQPSNDLLLSQFLRLPMERVVERSKTCSKYSI